MTNRREPLERIADALERLAPQVAAPIDWLAHPAYVWTGARVSPVSSIETVGLEQLCGIDENKRLVRDNFARFAAGAAAHDTLLWGARGMGKSALVRAAAQNVQRELGDAIALVQIADVDLSGIPDLIRALGTHKRAFLLFLDDLGFGDGEKGTNLALRSLLEGGVIARPSNVRLAVTSNRRAIVGRAQGESEALHERDERDDALALADRFGLTVGFHPPDRSTYLKMVRAYTDRLGLVVEDEEALAWAIARGNRSGRTAYQFACELAGRAGKPL